MLKSLKFPGLDELAALTPGRTVALTGVNATLAAVIACLTARAGKKTLLVMDNDLKASRAAEDVRQLTGGECAFLPGGEIDLTRAAGSLDNSWRRLEALTAVLREDPRPAYQDDPERVYAFEFGGKNVKFKVENGTLRVLSIHNS